MKLFNIFATVSMLLVGGGGSAFAQCPATCSKEPNAHKDVIVIGAGMAGVKAAQTLNEFSVDNLILEAADYVGGRMKTKKDYGAGNDQYQVELGANWIEGGSQNPILDLAWEHNVDYDKQFFEDWDTFEYSKDNGKAKVSPIRHNLVNKELNNLRKAWKNCLKKVANDYYESGGAYTYEIEDPSARQVLKDSCGWDPWGSSGTELQKEVDWYAFNYEFTYDTKDISLASFPEDTFRDFNRQRYLVFDQDDGYAGVAKHLADTSGVLSNIELDTSVDCIDWGSSENKVMIHTHNTKNPEDCKVYTADAVISTVSVGVLENKKDLFSPRLEEGKNVTKNVFEMGLYYKIFYQFEEKFWSDFEFINIVNQNEDERGNCTFWQNLDLPWFLPGSKILFCTVTTETIEELSLDGTIPESALEDFVKPLFKAFNKQPSDDILREYTPYYYNWKQDEYMYGSYANWKVGRTLSDFYDFFEPLKDNSGQPKVYFSGSATCFRYWEFVHGAYYAGMRSANQYLADIGEDVDTNSICDSLERR